MRIRAMESETHPDASVSGCAAEAKGEPAECPGNRTGTFSPVAQLCNGILDAVNGLGSVGEPAQQAIAVCISDILATFTEAERKVSTARQKISQLRTSLRRAKDEIANLRKARFGESSERSITEDADDAMALDLDGGDDPEDDDASQAQIKGRRASNPAPHIETRVVNHYPANRTCCTCGCEMPSIGSDTSTRTVLVPEHVVRIKEVYHRCACNHGLCKENKPVAAKSRHHIMKRRTLDLSVPVEAAVQKFFEHSTHYRMERRLNLEDLNIARQTLARNVEHMAKHLEPVYRAAFDIVREATVAFMDETPLRIQGKTKGKCDTGYLWGFSRDERGWNPDAKPVVYFHYASTRSGSVAKELLKDASVKFLQTDAYGAYRQLFESDGTNDNLARAGCVTHARRKFVEVETAGPSPLARRVITLMKKLYKIEEDIRGCPPSVREAVRQEKSLPLMLQIRDDLQKHADVAEGKVKAAINYALKSWDDFQRFIFDGRIEIDSNSIERCMRGIALTKKNSLFAGSHKAACVWAIYYTLFETARMNGVNPRSYLNWVVNEIERHRGDLDYSQLMPWNCPVGRVAG